MFRYLTEIKHVFMKQLFDTTFWAIRTFLKTMFEKLKIKKKEFQYIFLGITPVRMCSKQQTPTALATAHSGLGRMWWNDILYTYRTVSR